MPFMNSGDRDSLNDALKVFAENDDKKFSKGEFITFIITFINTFKMLKDIGFAFQNSSYINTYTIFSKLN